MYIITLLLRCRIHYFTQFEASKTKIAALQVQQPRKKIKQLANSFSKVTVHIKDIFIVQTPSGSV